jgi:hypothetical protein
VVCVSKGKINKIFKKTKKEKNEGVSKEEGRGKKTAN